MNPKAWLVALLLLGSATAQAGTVVKNGYALRISIAGHRERGVALRPGAEGWTVAVGGSDEMVAQLRDVTAGSSGDKWVVKVADGGLHLDRTRFVAGHAYRLELRRGATSMGTALIYLVPSRSGRGRTHVSFEDTEVASTAGESEDDGIAIMPKSAL